MHGQGGFPFQEAPVTNSVWPGADGEVDLPGDARVQERDWLVPAP